MPYTLIKGTFHIFYPLSPSSGPEPDGDTIKFQPTNKQLIEGLPRANMPAQFNQAGITSIRFEGMDALETHFEVEGDRYNQKNGLWRHRIFPKFVQSFISRESSNTWLYFIKWFRYLRKNHSICLYRRSSS